MATRYEPKDIDQILAELRGESDRAAISVGGSLLEYALELAIASRLRMLISSVRVAIFSRLYLQ